MESYKLTFTKNIANALVDIFFKCCGDLGDYRKTIYHYNPLEYFKMIITNYGFQENNNNILYKNTDKLFELICEMIPV